MLWIMNVARMERTLKGLVRVARRPDARGGKLGDDPRIAEAIGRLATDTAAMRCLGYRGFAKATRGEMPPEHLVLKLFCSEAEQRANLLAAESLGLEGLDLDGPGPNRLMEWDLTNFGPDTVELAAMNAFYDGSWAVQYLRSFSVHHRRRHVGDPAQHRGRARARSTSGVRSRLVCSQRSRPRRPNVSGYRRPSSPTRG